MSACLLACLLAAAAASATVAVVLAAIDLAKTLGWSERVPPLIMWPLTAGAMYVALYWLFDNYGWKLPALARLLRVPDLSGKWICTARSINPDKSLGYEWKAEIVIVQSWDRLRVRLKMARSTSNSVAAALVYDRADGFRLLYNYKNEPGIGEPELAAHRGSAELTFSADLHSAAGEYFNGHGRYSFGTMKLTRSGNDERH